MSDSRYTSSFLWLMGIILTAAAAGCGREPDFRVDLLDVRQLSWDSLAVRIQFVDESRLSDKRPVLPDSVWTTLFRANFDTLYSGSEGRIGIRDSDLGSREPLILESCGILNRRIACEQRALTASPKRLMPESQLSFPESKAYDRGTFRLNYRLLRQVFADTSWERITRRIPPETFLKAYEVQSPDDAVQIPVRRARNRLNLSHLVHYRDLRFRIKSALMDSDSATVAFDLYARLGQDPERVWSKFVVLRSMSREQRESELAALVEAAGNWILGRMKGFFGLRRAYVFINDWSYSPIDKKYEAEIELHWKTGFRGDWYDMIGSLSVRADGSAGEFRFLQGSLRAERRWMDRMDSTVVRLDPLSNARPDEDRGRDRIGF